MKKMTILKIRNMKARGILLLAVAVISASCSLIDFSEDCIYPGRLEIRPDWSGLAQGDTKPPVCNIYLSTENANPAVIELENDTVIEDFPAGYYRVLAFNTQGLEDITFSGTETAGLHTWEKEGRLYTPQVPTLYVARTDIKVNSFETAVCRPVMRNAARKVNINIVVTDMDMNSDIDNISGELSGISYQYSFSTMDELRSSAWLPFITTRTGSNSDSNVFASGFKVFGVNPDKNKSDKTDNLLELHIKMADGDAYTKQVDLTDIFNGFTARVINITLELRPALLDMEVVVTGWNISNEEDIEL